MSTFFVIVASIVFALTCMMIWALSYVKNMMMSPDILINIDKDVQQYLLDEFKKTDIKTTIFGLVIVSTCAYSFFFPIMSEITASIIVISSVIYRSSIEKTREILRDFTLTFVKEE